jgi:hypothetical protein
MDRQGPMSQLGVSTYWGIPRLLGYIYIIDGYDITIVIPMNSYTYLWVGLATLIITPRGPITQPSRNLILETQL